MLVTKIKKHMKKNITDEVISEILIENPNKFEIDEDGRK